MARFNAELPLEEIKELQDLETNCKTILEKMTQEGAKTVLQNISSNIGNSFGSDSATIMSHFGITRPYLTPSDDGVNTKVFVSGYMTNSNGKRVPVPLVVQAREYGTSNGEAKKPFFRKSFNKGKITEAMKVIERRYLPK